FDALLAEFSDDRRADVARFFGDVGTDQALLSQITPSGMDLFDQTAPDRPGVRYGCVVTRARPPAVTDAIFAGPTPVAQAMSALYTMSWVLASRIDPAHLP